MRVPDAGGLQRSVKNAQRSWEQANEVWKDSVKDRFEEVHWKPFLAQIDDVLKAMRELNEVLAKAERDCRA